MLTTTKPTLIYDGDCGLCRSSMAWLRERLRDKLQYVSFQEGAERFPQIPQEIFRSTVVLVHPEGNYSIKAQAALEALTLGKKHSLLRWSYFRVPGFAKLSNWIYDQVAKRRYLASHLKRCPL